MVTVDEVVKILDGKVMSRITHPEVPGLESGDVRIPPRIELSAFVPLADMEGYQKLLEEAKSFIAQVGKKGADWYKAHLWDESKGSDLYVTLNGLH